VASVFKVKGIMSVDILTPDVARMVDFYHGLLGLPFELPWDGNEDLAALSAGNLLICLMRTENATPPPRHSGDAMGRHDPQGFDCLAFHVDDLDAAMAALDGKVAWIYDAPREYQEDNGVYYRHRVMHDPDGNMVYLQVTNAMTPRVRIE
jgi:glyoxylase I family protein